MVMSLKRAKFRVGKIKLNEFDFTIEYRTEKNNYNAEYLIQIEIQPSATEEETQLHQTRY